MPLNTAVNSDIGEAGALEALPSEGELAAVKSFLVPSSPTSTQI